MCVICFINFFFFFFFENKKLLIKIQLKKTVFNKKIQIKKLKIFPNKFIQFYKNQAKTGKKSIIKPKKKKLF